MVKQNFIFIIYLILPNYFMATKKKKKKNEEEEEEEVDGWIIELLKER